MIKPTRGISALIPKKKRIRPEHGDSQAVFYIEIEKIKSNPYQPRKEFDFMHLKSLSESINDYGVLQPLLVSKIDRASGSGQETDYQLIAGERRLIASKMAGLTQVPVLIRNASSQEKLELSIIENVQREDLNAIEKALAYKRLESEFGLSQREIARICSKARVSITNTLRLLKLPEQIQLAIRENQITEGHGRALLQVSEDVKRDKIFEKILVNNLTVRDVESMAQDITYADTGKVKKISLIDKEIQGFETDFKQYLSYDNLNFRSVGNKHKIVISFDNKEEIRDFIKRFKV